MSDLTYQSRRKQDIENTEKVEKLMDKIYKKIGFKTERITDKELQVKGVDIIRTLPNGNKHYIDEKFALNYHDKKLNSFAFELSTNNNVDRNGWFISPQSQTTHYMLLWFSSNDTFDRFFDFEICYIEKKKIFEYLSTIGYNEQTLSEFIDFWKNPQCDSEKFYEHNNRRYMNLKDGVKIVQSLQFKKEKPINIVIPKKTLMKLCYRRIYLAK